MAKKKQTSKKTVAKKTFEPKSKAGVPRGVAPTKKEAKETKKAVPVAVIPEENLAPTPTAPTPAPTRDPRLPAVGTLIQKRDRHGAVRCECAIEEGGVRYAGNVYRSLSSAAMAAAKDLGLSNKTQNGFTFWGLSKPPRRTSDPLAALERAWTRYHGNVEALVKSGVTDENRSQVLSTIKKHVQAIESLREKAA